MNLITRNTCFNCPDYDSEESDDCWYQWCANEEAGKEEYLNNEGYVIICPITRKSIEED